jgi:hypothetical protein
MGLLDAIKALFAPSPTWLPQPRKLDGSSEEALAQALQQLRTEERGWITFAEARRLFSTMDEQYAFGEMDDDGQRKLASFTTEHRCDADLMPAEARVYWRASRPVNKLDG